MKSIVAKSRRLVLLRGPMIGVIAFAALSFLVANLEEKGSLPTEAIYPALQFALFLASIFAGACSGGAGKRGLFTGGMLGIVYLIGKAVFHLDAFFDLETLFGLLCIVSGSWLGSCIFHKKAGYYTKRNRKNRRRNYK